MLTDSEREEVFAAFAPEQRHRLYGRGIRRRLTPMLGHDQQRLLHRKHAYSMRMDTLVVHTFVGPLKR